MPRRYIIFFSFSAIKVNGRRAYALARQGDIEPLKARLINLSKLDLLEFTPPFFKLRIQCSGGTYVRSLFRDIGEELGTCGSMYELVRTEQGGFRLEDCLIVANGRDLRIASFEIPSIVGSRHPERLRQTLSIPDLVVIADSYRGKIIHVENENAEFRRTLAANIGDSSDTGQSVEFK